ncbi:hypothetical protein INT45_004133, partial [Circinella minor]
MTTRNIQLNCPHCRWTMVGTREEVKEHLSECITAKIERVRATTDPVAFPMDRTI